MRFKIPFHHFNVIDVSIIYCTNMTERDYGHGSDHILGLTEIHVIGYDHLSVIAL